ncbi:hypothetical protein GCM10010109_71300 [Actinoplanes campanulatus]|nr:hypothetical protein GCM10010109_71300 [Actinoplanes campanulatus]GID34890.1 hypothetical protein Aca09nite_13960 [Actinoplanes campanulatus]
MPLYDVGGTDGRAGSKKDRVSGVTPATPRRDRRSGRKREDRVPGEPASATDQGDPRVWPVVSGWRSVPPQER